MTNVRTNPTMSAAVPAAPLADGGWELVDTTGKRRATGTYEHCHAALIQLANSEFQTDAMTAGFTLRRSRRPKATKHK